MKRMGTRGLAALAGLIAWAGVGAQSPATSSAPDLDATVRAEVVDTLAKRLASSYAVAEAGEKMAEAVRSKLAAGAYDRLLAPEEFARALHTDVRAVVDDRHLRVTFDGARPAARPDGSPSVRPDARNGAIGRLEVLAGNIGYMEVSGVPPRANAAIDAAFAYLRNTDALVIDLRGNGGGWPDTVAYYMSYLSEGAPYTVVRIHDRQQGVIETKTTELGERSYGKKKPVYVLTSVLTFSGGEEFAYDVQAFKRGVIVGQTTGGGANPGGPHSLGHGFTAFVPTGFAKHPATGTNWEGVGVKPDVPVAPQLAVLEAHRLAAEPLAAATWMRVSRRCCGRLRQVSRAEEGRDPQLVASVEEPVAARRSLHAGRRGAGPPTPSSRKKGNSFYSPAVRVRPCGSSLSAPARLT